VPWSIGLVDGRSEGISVEDAKNLGLV
jgi:hypothetical protein